jgi:hypothetical protein
MARLPEVVREPEVLRVAGTLVGSDREDSVQVARKEVLRWAQNRSGGRLPAEAWEHQGFEYFSGGRNCVGARLQSDDVDLWAIRAEDPDKEVPRRIWTTEVVVGRQGEQAPRFSVRLLASSPEEHLAIEHHTPGFVAQVTDTPGVLIDGVSIAPTPAVILSDEQVDALINSLLDSTRRLPIYALSVPEHAVDHATPLIDAALLARATLGLAHVVVLPPEHSWALTNRFGKRLSVYEGAVRVYLPGFTEDADPYGGHRLFLADRLATPEKATECVRYLRAHAANESLHRARLGKEVLEFAAIRNASLAIQQSRLESEGASEAELLAIANKRIEALQGDLKAAQDWEQQLSDEHKAAEERAQASEAQYKAATFRIQQLLDQMKERGQKPDTTIPTPVSWSELVSWCDTHLAGRVALTPRARRETDKAEFEDVGLVARCLLWLANDYREARIEGGADFRDFYIEPGIKNAPCGGDAFPFQWQGHSFEAVWHIKNGGNTRDPRRCLRIYFDWDDYGRQVVVASLPAHIHTGIT